MSTRQRRRGLRTRLWIGLLSAVLLLTQTLVFADNQTVQILGDNNTVIFADVPGDYWARNEINALAQRGVVNGYTDGGFHPEDNVTREEFCKILATAFSQPLPEPGEPTFADVPASRWSYPYVELCRDFLTGYVNPFGGLPSFHPEEYAAREDIAVALVRMMGYTEADVTDSGYAVRQFSDGRNISPYLLPYVSLACEKNLLSGYPDGSFAPTQGITRAEVVVLLNRVTKRPMATYTSSGGDLEVAVRVSFANDGDLALVYVTTEEGAAVQVDGAPVRMGLDYRGEYIGCYVCRLTGGQARTLRVEAAKAGRSQVMEVPVAYEFAPPGLHVDEVPQETDKRDFTLSGTALDKQCGVSVSVNGKLAESREDAGSLSWSVPVTLEEGANTFTIVAENTAGKSVTETREVQFTCPAPTLLLAADLLTGPTVSKEEYLAQGTAYDDNYGVTVTVNGQEAASSQEPGALKWSAKVPLREGNNTVEVVAVNAAGKRTVQTARVNRAADKPVLDVDVYPETTDQDTVTLTGKLWDSLHDATVAVNGKKIATCRAGWDTVEWSAEVGLRPGKNSIKVVAENDAGKTVTRTCTITRSRVSASKPAADKEDETDSEEKDEEETQRNPLPGGETGERDSEEDD